MSRSRRWPAYLRREVYLRDRGVCADCGLDTEALRRELLEMDEQARRDRERMLRWPKHRIDYWDADHIVPFADEGPCELGNLRTLCLACHRRVTAVFMEQTGRAEVAVRARRMKRNERDLPEPDGGWWVATKAQRIECPQCGRTTDDRPGVMRYIPSADHGRLQAQRTPAWVQRGWAVWRECEHCSWMSWHDEHVTFNQIRSWNVGPWFSQP